MVQTMAPSGSYFLRNASYEPWFEQPGKHGIRFRDRDDYRERIMLWKLSLLLPPAFWKSGESVLLADAVGAHRACSHTG